jgi:uncharacterized membrane protein
MPLFVVGVVLFAAFIHASWNALLKTGSDTALTTTLITSAAACYAAILLPFLPAGLAGGAGTVSAYALALSAMTVAPVALVAALRETSILFATLISALVLKERVTLLRMVCTGLIAAGAATLAIYRG